MGPTTGSGRPTRLVHPNERSNSSQHRLSSEFDDEEKVTVLTASIKAGDRVIIHTPAGGGYGHLQGGDKLADGRGHDSKWKPIISPNESLARANGSVAEYASMQNSGE